MNHWKTATILLAGIILGQLVTKASAGGRVRGDTWSRNVAGTVLAFPTTHDILCVKS